MTKAHFLTLADLGAEGLVALLDRADQHRRARSPSDALRGRHVALVMEKASTRTRVSFEVAVNELGGHAVVISGAGSQLARGEPIEDTARVLSRYVHAIVLRTFGHARLTALAKYASVPVVNALTDDHHPCQILADLQTVRAERKTLDGLRVAWVGDGNNVAASWIEAASLLGFHLSLACPEGYDPKPEVLAEARARGRGEVVVTRDPDAACRGAHVVTTDVWASMGQEEETAARRKAFDGFLVDAARMSLAAPDVLFLHCLPAHRGEEVTADVIDGPRSRVWDEAENRLHTQKALLERLLVG